MTKFVKKTARRPSKKIQKSSLRSLLRLRSPLFIFTFALIGAAVMLTSFAAKNTAGGKTGFNWGTYDVSIANPVEQWTEWPFPSSDKWVSNTAAQAMGPGPCAWDVDDHWYLLANGTLNPGSTVTTDQCRVADPEKIWQVRYGQAAWWTMTERHTGIRIESTSPDLKVNLDYSPQGRQFTVLPTYDAGLRKYVYRACVGLVYHPNDPAWPYEKDASVQPIPGSNGGMGVITHASIKITNPTGRRVSATGKIEELAAWLSENTFSSYCGAQQSDYDAWQHEYPFIYRLN